MKYLIYRKVSFVLFWLFLLPFLFARDSSAAQFVQSRIRYDRMKTTSPTSLQILIVPSAASVTGTEAKLKINFGGLIVGTVPTTSITNLPAGAIALPGTFTVAGSGTSMVISGLTNLTAGTTYVVNIDTGVSTPGAANQYLDTIETQDSGNARIDATVIATRVITDDQLVLTGNVPPSFNFVLSGNTDVFTADLDASNVRSTNGRTVTVTTNANKGWIGWVKSLNVGLSSATTGESILTTGTIDATPGTCTVGTDCYLLDADLTTNGAGTGSLVIDPEYNGAVTGGGTLSTILQPFVSRTGKTAGDVITLIARATIVGTKAAAADYTDTLTVIGAGNF